MELIHNTTFRILPELNPSTEYAPGIYRVILDEPRLNKIITVIIQPDGEPKPKTRGRKMQAATKNKRKKGPAKLIGELLWMDRDVLLQLQRDGQLKAIAIERGRIRAEQDLGEKDQEDFKRRKNAMNRFFDFQELRDGILLDHGIGGLVKQAQEDTGASRALVYKCWSLLCRWGISETSLMPQRFKCGAPGVMRPCDPGGRKKPGRKTNKQRVSLAYGVTLDPDQPGMSSEWAAAIRAADKQIPTPKPRWPERCLRITNSAFCSKAKEENGKLILVTPEFGQYPNDSQIKHVLIYGVSRLQRLLDRTTRRHFERALRGLVARNWQGVAGPGHTWAIDSTVGDIYLRSSVDRAWILGRPIVYVIVDVWSTAVVGFYVCLTGPSWNTAKVSLFNAVADPELLGELWGYQPILTLNPLPTMPYALLCDRGEYLSQGHRHTAVKFLPLTSYTPPYRGDLKGLAEVLHRIEKDKQYPFIPGAMDFRRQELELRKVNPEDCVLTLREYVHYLYELFTECNLTADRRHRIDAYMQAAGVFPSPAGLWRYGHDMGVGFRRHIDHAEFITELLPPSTARVRRDAVRHAGNDYMSPEVQGAEWTAVARNFGGWDIPVNYYPGSLARIWTPNPTAGGLLDLHIADESRGSADLSFEEWSDVLADQTMKGAGIDHIRKMQSLDTWGRMKTITDNAVRLTREAVAKASGQVPTMTEARAMEVAAMSQPDQSENKAADVLQEEAMDAHLKMMEALIHAADVDANAEEERHALS